MTSITKTKGAFFRRAARTATVLAVGFAYSAAEVLSERQMSNFVLLNAKQSIGRRHSKVASAADRPLGRWIIFQESFALTNARQKHRLLAESESLLPLQKHGAQIDKLHMLLAPGGLSGCTNASSAVLNAKRKARTLTMIVRWMFGGCAGPVTCDGMQQIQKVEGLLLKYKSTGQAFGELKAERVAA